MNLFINWGYDVNGEGFDQIIKSLKVENCFYSSCNKKNVDNKITQFRPIDLDLPLKKYMENSENMIPIDGDLLEDMEPYERMAMDIIYRWRRSITTNFDYENMKSIYKIYLKYWNNFLIKEKIDLVILFNVPHIPSLFFLYALSKIHGIPIVILKYITFLNNGYHNKVISSDIFGLDDLFVDELKKLKEEYKDVEEEDITLSSGMNDYFLEYKKENIDIRRVIYDPPEETILSKVGLIIERGLIYLNKKEIKILMNKVLYYSKYRFLSKKILKYISSIEITPDLDKDFAFFPLHCQPEASTLPLAGSFVDQKMIVEMVRKSLPDEIVLYVKEHPAYWDMKGRYEGVFESRSIEFYDYINNLENVKFIKHDYNSLELIDKCKFLVTATGSAAMEASFKDVPVLSFSEFIYSYLPGVYKIKNNKDCEEAISEILNSPMGKNNKEFKLYFKALDKFYLRVGVTQGVLDDDNISAMNIRESSIVTATKILKYIQEKYPERIGIL